MSIAIGDIGGMDEQTNGEMQISIKVTLAHFGGPKNRELK
jgi:hypothetical protein